MWVNRYFHTSFHPWKLILKWHLTKLGGITFLDNINACKKDIKNAKLLPFLKSLAMSWTDYIRKPFNAANILDQNFFYNDAIRTPT